MKVIGLLLVFFLLVMSLIHSFCNKCVGARYSLPWTEVGGCGVGGGGGGSGGLPSGGVQWVGSGVSGGLIDVDIITNSSIGDASLVCSALLKIAHRAKYNNLISASIPCFYKQGEYLLASDYLLNKENVSSFGDFGIEYTRIFGRENLQTFNLGLSIPIADYKMRRESVLKQEPPLFPIIMRDYVPPVLQPGSGLKTVTVALGHTIERDRSFYLFNLGYAHNFLNWATFFKSFSIGGAQNDLWKGSSYTTSEIGVGEKEYETTLQSWYNLPFPWEEGWGGEPLELLTSPIVITREIHVRNVGHAELSGDFYGNSLSFSTAYGLNREGCVHSMQLSFSYKVSSDWYIRKVDISYLNHRDSLIDERVERFHLLPIVDEAGKNSWSLGYGLELSNTRFPLFMGLGTALNGNAAITNFFFTLGAKGSFF